MCAHPAALRLHQARSLGSPEGVYAWLSSDQILLLHAEGRNGQGAFFRYNSSTGQEVPLTAFTRHFRQANGGQYPQLSPDKTWALWTDGNVHHVTLYTATLDGRRHATCLKAKTEWDNPFYFWMADSRHWVELVAPSGYTLTQARIHSVEDPQAVQKLPIAGTNPLNIDHAAFTAGNDIQVGGKRLVLLPCGSSGSYCGVSQTLQVTTLGILPGAEPPHTYRFPAPSGAEMHCGVALSPQGDRIAWFFAGEKKGPVPAPRQRLVPDVPVPSDYFTSLWVSKVDGSDMHQIGYQESARPSNKMGDHMMTFAASAPGNLLWLPDGKQISFQYKQSLYVVPAE